MGLLRHDYRPYEGAVDREAVHADDRVARFDLVIVGAHFGDVAGLRVPDDLMLARPIRWRLIQSTWVTFEELVVAAFAIVHGLVLSIQVALHLSEQNTANTTGLWHCRHSSAPYQDHVSPHGCDSPHVEHTQIRGPPSRTLCPLWSSRVLWLHSMYTAHPTFARGVVPKCDSILASASNARVRIANSSASDSSNLRSDF